MPRCHQHERKELGCSTAFAELTIVDVFPVPDDLTAAFACAEMRVIVLETPPAPVKRDASAENAYCKRENARGSV